MNIWTKFLLLYMLLVFINMNIISIVHKTRVHGFRLPPLVNGVIHVYLWLFFWMHFFLWLGYHFFHHKRADQVVDRISPKRNGLLRTVFMSYFDMRRTVHENYDEVLALYNGKYKPDFFDRIEPKLVVPGTKIGLNFIFGPVVSMCLGFCFGHLWLGLLMWYMVVVTCGINWGIGNYWGHQNPEYTPGFGNASGMPWFLTLLLGGEGPHDLHHRNPSVWYYGTLLDTSGLILKLFHFCGLGKPS